MADKNEYPIAIVDRIEAGIAVLEEIESRITFDIPVKLLPDDVHEGAAVELGFRLRPEIEKARRKEIRDLQQRLMEKPDS